MYEKDWQPLQNQLKWTKKDKKPKQMINHEPNIYIK